MVDETHRIAGIILEHLFVKPLRWSDLEKLTVISSPTYSKFQTVLRWLASNGFIKKGLQHRDPYVITDKGKAFLVLSKLNIKNDLSQIKKDREDIGGLDEVH